MTVVRKISKYFSFILAIFVCICLLFSTAVFAQEKFSINKDSMQNVGILGTSNIKTISAGSSDTSALNGLDSSTQSISIDKLFGANDRSFEYYGEVPNPESKEYGKSKGSGSSVLKEYKDKPHETDGYVGGVFRKWWNDPLSINDNLEWDKSKTSDIHAKSLKEDKPIINVGRAITSVIWQFLSMFNYLNSFILNAFISLANWDVQSLLNTIGFSDVAKTVSNLVVGENGITSPIAWIALLAFGVTIIVLLFKFVRQGNASLQAIGKEFFILILGLVCMLASMNGNLNNTISSTNNLTNQVAQTLSTSSSEDFALFVNKTGNSNADIRNNQIAITAKPYIDIIIEKQFGYTVNDLRLYDDNDPSVSEDNWGVSTQRMKELISNLSSENTDVLFDVSTGNGLTNASSPNLGYFFYAVCSNVNYQDPFYKDGNKIVTNSGDHDTMLLMTDLLASIDAEVNGSQKCQSIMTNLYQGTEMSGIGSLFIQNIVSVALILALIMSCVYCIFGKLLFNVGMILLPFIGVCLLPEKTRKIAKQLACTWFNGLIKMLLGMVFLGLTIYISAILCSSGIVGQVLDIIVLFLIFKNAPKLMTTISSVSERVSGGNSIAPVRTADQSIARFANKMSSNNIGRNIHRNMKNQLKEQEKNKPHTPIMNFEADKEVNDVLSNFAQNRGEGKGSATLDNELVENVQENVKLKEREYIQAEKENAFSNLLKDPDNKIQGKLGNTVATAYNKLDEFNKRVFNDPEKLEKRKRKNLNKQAKLEDKLENPSMLVKIAALTPVGKKVQDMTKNKLENTKQDLKFLSNDATVGEKTIANKMQNKLGAAMSRHIKVESTKIDEETGKEYKVTESLRHLQNEKLKNAKKNIDEKHIQLNANEFKAAERRNEIKNTELNQIAKVEFQTEKDLEKTYGKSQKIIDEARAKKALEGEKKKQGVKNRAEKRREESERMRKQTYDRITGKDHD